MKPSPPSTHNFDVHCIVAKVEDIFDEIVQSITVDKWMMVRKIRAASCLDEVNVVDSEKSLKSCFFLNSFCFRSGSTVFLLPHASCKWDAKDKV